MISQQEFGNDLLDVVGHEHLTVEQLDLALLAAKVLADAGEVQDALEVEGIIHVQVDPEQGLLKGVEQLVIAVLVFLLGAVLGSLEPQGMGVVEGLGLLGFLAFLGFLGLFVRVHQIDRHGHVAAVAIQDLANPIGVQEFLFLVRDMQGDGGTALGAGALAHGELHAVLAFPAHGGRALLEAEGVDGHLVGGHEGAVKAQAEMADDAALGVALVLFEEFLGAGEGHLVDVLVHFLGGHADAVILVTASQPLATSSRMKISLSEYSQRLITGMMFCAWMEILPFLISDMAECASLTSIC